MIKPEPGIEERIDVDAASCLDVLQRATDGNDGIVRLRLDTANEQIALEYDPQRTSDDDVQHVIQQVSPVLRERWDRCTVRLERQGGRACEACALALENRLREVSGVRRATASYIAGVMTIHYDDTLTSPAALLEEVEALGVGVSRPESALPTPALVWDRTRAWLGSDRAELVFAAITLVAMILGFILDRLGLTPLSWAAYGLGYITGGAYGLRAGLESLRSRAIDVDLLMILAAIGAAIVGAPFEGVMLLFLFSLSNVLQNLALDRTRSAIRSLMALRPNTALLRRGQVLVEMAVEQVVVGDLMVIRPGDRVPLDGEIVDGASSFDQSAITGESIPVHRKAGDQVLAGSINQQGSLEVRVTRMAQDSTLARLVRLVEEAQSEKAKTQRFIDVAEQYYATGVIIMTALAVAIPSLFLGEGFDTAFYRAMTLMVAASPCALVISTPATVLSAIANGARRGILFKGGVYLEQAAGIKVLAFDKTGTLTFGKPEMTDIRMLPDGDLNEDDLLRMAAALENKSEHPLAEAIVRAANQRGLDRLQARDFFSDTGQGVRGHVETWHVAVGNRRYFERFAVDNWADAEVHLDALHAAGKTAVIVATLHDETAHLRAVLGIADVLRPNAADVINEVKALGVTRVVMLTGDNRRVAEAVGQVAGVDEVHAELLPEEKYRLLKELSRTYGPVAMVGDGVNDAPALAAADIGIAMGAAGTDVALETADVVLMADELAHLPYAIALSRKTRQRLVQNLSFAVGTIVVLIAAVLGFSLPLPLGVVGHEGSTVLVSLNGLRLLGYRG